MNNKYTIISDPGIDDLIALLLLHKLNTNVKNCLISTFGNATESITSINAKEFVSFCAPHWKYMHGSSLPYNKTIEHPWPDYFHGPDGVWNVHPNTDTSKVLPINKLNTEKVISLATLADVYKLYKDIKIQDITIMGGAFLTNGNETEFAETNIAFDPDSAYHFFNEFKNIKTNIVPLDVTRKVFWTFDNVNQIPENNDINKWIKKMLLTWFDKYNHNREENFNLHDPLAVYLSYFYDDAVWYSSGVEVITTGVNRGQTIFSHTNYKCNIALVLYNPQQISKNIFTKVFLEK